MLTSKSKMVAHTHFENMKFGAKHVMTMHNIQNSTIDDNTMWWQIQ